MLLSSVGPWRRENFPRRELSPHDLPLQTFLINGHKTNPENVESDRGGSRARLRFDGTGDEGGSAQRPRWRGRTASRTGKTDSFVLY